jgi:hypothetical protein
VAAGLAIVLNDEKDRQRVEAAGDFELLQDDDTESSWGRGDAVIES